MKLKHLITSLCIAALIVGFVFVNHAKAGTDKPYTMLLHDSDYQGYTYIYFQMIHTDTGQVLNPDTMTASLSTVWSDSDIAMAANTDFMFVKMTAPANIPAGRWDIRVYGSEDMVADKDDTYLGGWRFLSPLGAFVDPTIVPVDELGRVRIIRK